MKKLTLIAALCAAMACSAFATNNVYSSNVVGYNKITINPGLNMISPCFVNVGDGSAQAMNDLFPEAEAKATAGVGSDVSDNIKMWVAGSYESYFYYNEDIGPEWDYKWYDALDDEEPTLDEIDTKDGFWYLSRAAEAYTTIVKGQVSSEAGVSITINPGLNMIANPYPVALPLNGLLDWDALGAVSGVGSDVSDNIKAWVDGSYESYFFYNEDIGAEWDYKWYDALDDEEPTTYEIPVGAGVWYLFRGTEPMTVTIANPMLP